MRVEGVVVQCGEGGGLGGRWHSWADPATTCPHPWTLPSAR